MPKDPIEAEETRKKMRTSAKKRWDDPKCREEMSIRKKQYYKDNPDACKNQREYLIKLYEEHPEKRERAREKTIEQFKIPGMRERIGKGVSKHYEDPLARKAASDAAIKRFEDPKERERLGSLRRGTTQSFETKQKASKSIKQFWDNNPELKIERSKAFRGENNPAWEGGITSINTQVRHCYKMEIWRGDVFKRDNYKDWFSGCRGTHKNPIRAHHIIHFNTIMKKYNIKTLEEAEACDELWDVNNGITMLKKSHDAYHDMWGK